MRRRHAPRRARHPRRRRLEGARGPASEAGCARSSSARSPSRIGAASVREIDRINIYHASRARDAARAAAAAAHAAPRAHRRKPDPQLPVSSTAASSVATTCYTIACASIVAKVTRDRLMTSLARRYPLFAWERTAAMPPLARRGPAGRRALCASPAHLCRQGAERSGGANRPGAERSGRGECRLRGTAGRGLTGLCDARHTRVVRHGFSIPHG